MQLGSSVAQNNNQHISKVSKKKHKKNIQTLKQIQTYQKKIKAEHKAFIAFMVPRVQYANRKIIQQREELHKLHNIYKETGQLNIRQFRQLKLLATNYKIPEHHLLKEKAWKDFYKRIDIIPTSLVIAQAINESAWGLSRFALEGNNFFGQWCYTRGCGLVPKRRPTGKTYEVKRFANALYSIISYMRNLNSSSAYKHFRELRAKSRKHKKTLNAISLAKGLTNYSVKGHRYVKIIRNIIKNYHLQHFDYFTQAASL